MAHNLIAQKFRILVFKSQAVIFCILAPLLQINYQVNVLVQLYAFYTKQGFYVNDTDTPELLLDSEPNQANQDTAEEQKAAVYIPNGKLAIPTFDHENVIVCHAVKSSKILAPGKNEPKYILLGVDKVTFWGEHTTILGWYETLEDIQQEIANITSAINSDKTSYTLKYAADVEYVGLFGQAKLKKANIGMDDTSNSSAS